MHEAAPVCEFLHFRPVFDLSSIWKLLGTSKNFLHFGLSSKTFQEPLIFNIHILDPSCDVLICRITWFLTTKHSKHLWSCM